MQRFLPFVAGLALLVGAAAVLGSPGAPRDPVVGPVADPEPLLGPRMTADPAAPSPVAAPVEGPVAAPVEGPATPPHVRVHIGARPAKLAAVRVSLADQRAVWLDPTEVSVASWKGCVAAGACKKDQYDVQPGTPCNYDTPGRADHPMNCVDWNGAEAYCAWTGGRLCKEEEWFAGCRGPEGRDYPYGASFDESACNVGGSKVPPEERGTTPVASVASCQGGYPGLYDMVGNVAEWLDACQGDYCHFYGGAFLENEPLADFGSCKRFCAGNKKPFRSATIGFRCCHDAAPGGR